MKWINQFKAMQHILNTGQGVVMEGCANADYCHFNAAYQAGWIQDEMKSLYGILTKNTLFHVFKFFIKFDSIKKRSVKSTVNQCILCNLYD